MCNSLLMLLRVHSACLESSPPLVRMLNCLEALRSRHQELRLNESLQSLTPHVNLKSRMPENEGIRLVVKKSASRHHAAS